MKVKREKSIKKWKQKEIDRKNDQKTVREREETTKYRKKIIERNENRVKVKTEE